MQVLSTTLQQQELETVFGNVARLYSTAIAEAFMQLPNQVSSHCTVDRPLCCVPTLYRAQQGSYFRHPMDSLNVAHASPLLGEVVRALVAGLWMACTEYSRPACCIGRSGGVASSHGPACSVPAAADHPLQLPLPPCKPPQGCLAHQTSHETLRPPCAGQAAHRERGAAGPRHAADRWPETNHQCQRAELHLCCCCCCCK